MIVTFKGFSREKIESLILELQASLYNDFPSYTISLDVCEPLEAPKFTVDSSCSFYVE